MVELNPDAYTSPPAIPKLGLQYKRVPHYHGDPVRQLFVFIAVLSAVVLPLWGNLLPFGTMFQIVGALILVLLAGLTNPHGTIVAIVDVVFAAAGAFLFEAAAIYFYDVDPMKLFLVREIVAILFLFALYFSVKTLRAMLLGQVGHIAPQGEFEKTKQKDTDRSV